MGSMSLEFVENKYSLTLLNGETYEFKKEEEEVAACLDLLNESSKRDSGVNKDDLGWLAYGEAYDPNQRDIWGQKVNRLIRRLRTIVTPNEIVAQLDAKARARSQPATYYLRFAESKPPLGEEGSQPVVTSGQPTGTEDQPVTEKLRPIIVVIQPPQLGDNLAQIEENKVKAIQDLSMVLQTTPYLSSRRAEEIIVQSTVYGLRDCVSNLYKQIPNAIGLVRGMFERSSHVVESLGSAHEVELPTEATSTGPPLQDAPVMIPELPIAGTSFEDKETEYIQLSEQEFAALSLVVASLNGTSLGIDEHTAFEFKVSKEVIDICNRWIWSLPFEHVPTTKLNAKDYLNLRQAVLKKVCDILRLDEDKILETATEFNNEDMVSLVLNLSEGTVVEREKMAWFFEQNLLKEEVTTWDDEISYVIELWREQIPQGSKSVQGILKTDQYLEIVPFDYSEKDKPRVSEPDSVSTIQLGMLERRDPEIHETMRGYIRMVREQKRIPSVVNSGQLTQYFKPAITKQDVEDALDREFITPALFRDDIPYYNEVGLVTLLYLRNKPRRVDVTGLQKELRRIVEEGIETQNKPE